MNYDAMILDLYSQIAELKLQVTELNNKLNSKETSKSKIKTNERDKSRYEFNNKILLKNALVFEVIKKYIEDNPNASFEELKKIFPDDLQGNFGVIKRVENINPRDHIRYNMKHIFRLKDIEFVVCRVWMITNIEKFILKAKSIGYDIKIHHIFN